MKYPLWARETAGLKGAQVSVLVNGVWVDGTIGEDPEFEPEGQLSFYAHMDLWRSKNWDLRLRYVSFRFDASDLVEAPFLLADGTRGSLLVRQPDSHADTYGLEFRRRF